MCAVSCYCLYTLTAMCKETMEVCIRRMFACISVVVTVSGSVGMFVVYCELWVFEP